MDNQKDPQSLKQKIIDSIKATEEDLSAIVEMRGKVQDMEAASAALKKSLNTPEGQPDTLMEDLNQIQQTAQKRDKQLKDLDAKIEQNVTEAVDKASQDLHKSDQA